MTTTEPMHQMTLTVNGISYPSLPTRPETCSA